MAVCYLVQHEHRVILYAFQSFYQSQAVEVVYIDCHGRNTTRHGRSCS